MNLLHAPMFVSKNTAVSVWFSSVKLANYSSNPFQTAGVFNTDNSEENLPALGGGGVVLMIKMCSS